jgi:hypothetical protein
MGVRSILSGLRIQWRAASLHGAATNADRRGEHGRAFTLATSVVELLERCPDQTDPGVVSRYVSSVVLLDQLASKVGRVPPIERLKKAYDAAAQYRGRRTIDEALRWFEYRLKQLNQF